jgi:prepilin-type N-terminal cleavage/methylation domain-containing protein
MNSPVVRRRRGFTLIEAMTAVAVLGIAGATLLVGLGSSAATTRDALERTVALGLAQQLLDEVSGMRYCEYGGSAYDSAMGPGSPEIAAGARMLFDDIDDYNGVRTTPVTDRYGIALGTDDGKGGVRYVNFQTSSGFFTGWKQIVDVQYVLESNLSTVVTSGTSSYRRIRVQITVDQADGTTRTLADVSRVVSYAPAM